MRWALLATFGVLAACWSSASPPPATSSTTTSSTHPAPPDPEIPIDAPSTPDAPPIDVQQLARELEQLLGPQGVPLASLVTTDVVELDLRAQTIRTLAPALAQQATAGWAPRVGGPGVSCGPSRPRGMGCTWPGTMTVYLEFCFTVPPSSFRLVQVLLMGPGTATKEKRLKPPNISCF